jgi:hypothetical protein
MSNTQSIADYIGPIYGRAGLIISEAHKAGRFAVEIKAIAEDLTHRASFETRAEFELRQAEIALSLVLDDIRAARAKLAALPIGPIVEVAA